MDPIAILAVLILGGFALKPYLPSSKPFSPPTPDEEREFRKLRADARAIRGWSKTHKADNWSYEQLISALMKDSKFGKWDRERLDSAIEEDADT